MGEADNAALKRENARLKHENAVIHTNAITVRWMQMRARLTERHRHLARAWCLRDYFTTELITNKWELMSTRLYERTKYQMRFNALMSLCKTSLQDLDQGTVQQQVLINTYEEKLGEYIFDNSNLVLRMQADERTNDRIQKWLIISTRLAVCRQYAALIKGLWCYNHTQKMYQDGELTTLRGLYKDRVYESKWQNLVMHVRASKMRTNLVTYLLMWMHETHKYNMLSNALGALNSDLATLRAENCYHTEHCVDATLEDLELGSDNGELTSEIMLLAQTLQNAETAAVKPLVEAMNAHMDAHMEASELHAQRHCEKKMYARGLQTLKVNCAPRDAVLREFSVCFYAHLQQCKALTVWKEYASKAKMVEHDHHITMSQKYRVFTMFKELVRIQRTLRTGQHHFLLNKVRAAFAVWQRLTKTGKKEAVQMVSEVKIDQMQLAKKRSVITAWSLIKDKLHAAIKTTAAASLATLLLEQGPIMLTIAKAALGQ